MLEIAKKTILGIDFDETICNVSNFPEIDSLKKDAKFYINKLFDEGFFIKINTCRTAAHETQAKEFLEKEGIKFHLINENHPDLIKFYKNNCRKISADIYIDDKNIDTILDPSSHEWDKIYEKIHKIVSNPLFKPSLSFTS